MTRFVRFTLVASIAMMLGVGQPVHAGEAPLAITGAITVNADDLLALVQADSDLIIFDNRTIADYESGHIEGALHLIDSEMSDEAVLARVVKAKDVPILFYCNGVKCGRAANATAKAVAWGYSRVYYYALGMAEWKKRGLPLVH